MDGEKQTSVLKFNCQKLNAEDVGNLSNSSLSFLCTKHLHAASLEVRMYNELVVPKVAKIAYGKVRDICRISSTGVELLPRALLLQRIVPAVW